MKRKNILFILGAACLLSIGAISFSNSPLTVHAVTDVGEIQFTELGSGASTNKAVYLVTTSSNVMNSNWSGPYKPVSGQGGVYINDQSEPSLQFQLKKANTYDYYFESTGDAIAANTTLKLFGVWQGYENGSSGTEYKFTVLESTVIKTETGWKVVAPPPDIPELDVYDKVTLKDAGIDDYDRQTIDIYKTESAWNSFAVSPENTKKSFAFEFVYQAYERMTTHLEFRVGARGNYYSPHCYHFVINNSWGSNGQYQLSEEYNEQAKSGSGFKNFPTDIKTGRHIVEFGSIYLADNSGQTFDYVKYDDEYIYTSVVTPFSDERTTKVSLYIGQAKIFVGSTTAQKERDTTLSFNRTYDDKGIYLNGPVNDIPVDNNWKVRAAPATKYNALLNGEPLYNYEGSQPPLVKFSEEEDNNYYISFNDFGLRFNEGDVVTLSDEFHFFYQDVVYVVSLYPISFLYNGSSFVPVNNIYDYLINIISNRCIAELYSDENLAEINRIISEAETALPLKTNMKQLWDLYKDYINQLDSIPLDEERAAEYLRPIREAAIAELNDYYDPTNYTQEHLNEILGIINDAAADINACMSTSGISEIVVNAKTEIDAVPTRQAAIESAILASDTLLDEYLETYDVVTTSDLCASGGMTFTSDSTTYSSGDLKDITTRIAASEGNRDGNMIFQFNYSSTNYNSRRYGAQVFVRVRGTPDNCARFDIGSAFNSHSGVRLVVDNVSLQDYDANFVQRSTPYKIECGSIDLDGFNRTLLFIKVDGSFVIKKIVNIVSSVQTPTIQIFDSYTTGSDTVTFSPIEEGTTKNTKSTVIGNLSLDSYSNKESLQVVARANNIPVETTLYPMSDNAFTVNGVQVKSARPTVSLYKASSTNYEVNFDKSSLQDGDVVKLNGVFCSHNSAKGLKQAYQLYEAEFVYHAATDSWTQNETSLEDAQRNAKDMLCRYYDLNDYSEASQNVLSEITASYEALIDNAIDANAVNELLNEALGQIDLVPTLVMDYRNNAKEELRTYASAHTYREDEQIELNNILAEAYQNIDSLDDFDDIDRLVENTKADIDTLKTAEERDAEDLEVEKKLARAEVETYVGLLEMNRYSQENIELIRTLALTARSDIENAANSEQVQNILATFKEAIKNVQTNDGSVFNGETYINPNSKQSGCGGNIMTTSIVLSALSLVGLLIILRKKHSRMFINK